MRRRSFVAMAGALLPLGAAGQKRVDLSEFQPQSKLTTKQTAVDKPRFPVIDVHTHLSFSRDDRSELRTTPEEALAVMNRCNLRTLVNLTGGRGKGLQEIIERFDRQHPGRFLTFTEPWWSRANDADYPKFQADQIEWAKRQGAHGLKVLKTLGLYLRDGQGKLVTVDDKRFDPMWEACGAARMPVAIHVSDPVAFFEPIDAHNERFEELNRHPDWSFYGKDYPKHEEILAARDRVMARHPKTQFLVLHVGNYAENLGHVSERLDRFPNMTVEIGARIGELGRQPRASRRFFDKYQDRILFGTDATPKGTETPQQLYVEELYRIYARFLETEDEYFDYAPAPVPPQGRWRIYGLGLPDRILKKVYSENAARLLGLA